MENKIMHTYIRYILENTTLELTTTYHIDIKTLISIIFHTSLKINPLTRRHLNQSRKKLTLDFQKMSSVIEKIWTVAIIILYSRLYCLLQ